MTELLLQNGIMNLLDVMRFMTIIGREPETENEVYLFLWTLESGHLNYPKP